MKFYLDEKEILQAIGDYVATKQGLINRNVRIRLHGDSNGCPDQFWATVELTEKKPDEPRTLQP